MQTDPVQIAEMSAVQELISRDVLTHMYESATPQLFSFDAQTLKLISANRAARVFLGKDMRRLRHRLPWQIWPLIGEDRFLRLLAALQRRQSQKVDLYLHQDGPEPVVHAVTVLYQDTKQPTYVVTIRDVTRLSQYKRDAAAAEQRLTTAINALSDGFVLYDADEKLILCNNTYREIYSLSAAAMVRGAKFSDILRFGLDNGQYAEAEGREDAWLDERMRAHRAGNVDIEQQLSDGRWLRIVERPTDDGGRVGLRVDITALKDQQARLSKMLLTDDLTGLRNRHQLAAEISGLVDGLNPRERVAVLHVDLDRFKVVNDVFGHDAGDFVLCTCADIMAGGPVPPRIAARVGGDEFISVLVTQKSKNEVLRYARQISKRIAEPIGFDGHQCNVGASIGIAFVEDPGEKAASEALTAADIALHQAKRGVARGVVTFEPAMRTATVRNSEVAQKMQIGIQRGEFLPHFQPQVNARSGGVMGFEALIRWIPHDGKPVPAGEFLDVAQNAGLTEMLDDIVMDQSCQAVRFMLDWGLKSPCVSLNMSMLQVSDSNLVDRLEFFMKKHGIKHRHLRIELLESTLLDERAAHIIENVHSMIKAGFRVELDDFGTGHAAIATLRKFSVSQIKIDRSLVRHIDQDDELQTITCAIVDLAKNLGISVLAEGVETQAEQDMLLSFDCDTAQGYLHAKPMPLPELRQYLADRGDIRIT